MNIGELFADSLTPTPVLPAAQGGGAGRNLVDIPVTRQEVGCVPGVSDGLSFYRG